MKSSHQVSGTKNAGPRGHHAVLPSGKRYVPEPQSSVLKDAARSFKENSGGWILSSHMQQFIPPPSDSAAWAGKCSGNRTMMAGNSTVLVDQLTMVRVS